LPKKGSAEQKNTIGGNPSNEPAVKSEKEEGTRLRKNGSEKCHKRRGGGRRKKAEGCEQKKIRQRPKGQGAVTSGEGNGQIGGKGEKGGATGKDGGNFLVNRQTTLTHQPQGGEKFQTKKKKNG